MNPYVYPGVVSIKPSVELLDRTLYGLTGITFNEAKTRKRDDKHVLYRTLYWYFYHKYYPCKLRNLKLIFCRDHATVLYALKRCKNKYDRDLQEKITECEKIFLQNYDVLKLVANG
jgi:chromosomal replication initiation ATPase DnaA